MAEDHDFDLLHLPRIEFEDYKLKGAAEHPVKKGEGHVADPPRCVVTAKSEFRPPQGFLLGEREFTAGPVSGILTHIQEALATGH